jgi:hypothetical protein
MLKIVLKLVPFCLTQTSQFSYSFFQINTVGHGAIRA